VLHHGIVIIGPDDRVRLRLGEQLPNRVVSVITRDRAGTLWLGTNAGLVAVRDGAVERTLTVADGLPDHRVISLLRDRDDNVWIGTLSGVALLKNGALTSPPGVEALAEDHVRAIHQDDAGTIWFGTADAGLIRFRDGRTTRYTTASGLASNGVFAILDDGAGHFWTSSNRGLAQVSRRELDDFAEGRIPLVTARAFTRADGLRTLEANGGRQPAAFRARDGRLWFATARGAAIVDPKRIRPGVAPLAPVIESVSVAGRARVAPTEVDVPPGQAFVSVTYGVGLLSSPETVRFRVRLAGLDEEWSDVGRERSVTYSHLRPGSYRFEVAAVNAGQVGPAVVLPIRVRPRFFETTAFLLMAITAVGGSLLLVAQKSRTRRRRAQRQEREFARRLLASQDRERQRLAAEVHDGLGQHLLVIRNQALLGTDTTTGDCLESIADTAAQALDEVRAIAAALHPATLERLGLIRALAALVRALSQSRAVPITLEAPDRRRLPPPIELQLYRIVQESLSNALKHANAAAMSVAVVFTDQHLEIVVRDDGKGFDPAAVALRGDGSLGLSSMRERARSIGAELSVISAPGGGTTVRIRLSLASMEAAMEIEPA
jgi:signal transduction histidine kinase